MIGSSPLTRGKHNFARACVIRERLIPAHAGKTPELSCHFLKPTAHPRSRGENFVVGLCACCASGSSPLTRGKQALGPLGGIVSGLIPAHAGKTARPSPASNRLAAHPRSRGENLDAGGLSGHGGGSSPLTRGKRCWCSSLLVLFGLIPAHAGKTRAGAWSC